MSVSDPIADMLTIIRNGLSAKLQTVMVRASGICEGVCRVLKEEGYIGDFKRVDDSPQGHIRVYLKYGPAGEQVVSVIKRISKPGCRVYRGVGELPRPMNGMGIVVVSTPRGILSDRQCRDQKVGGEVLCEVC